ERIDRASRRIRNDDMHRFCWILGQRRLLRKRSGREKSHHDHMPEHRILRNRSKVNCSRSARFQSANFIPPLEPPRKIEGKSVEIILNSQFLGSMNRPMWVVKKLPRKRDQISLSGAEYLLGVTRFGNQSHRNSLDAGFVPHALRIGDMVARSTRHNFSVDWSAYATRRTGDDIHPAIRQFAREDDRIVDRPLAPWPVGGRASKKQRPVIRPHCPHCLGNFEREPLPPWRGAAVTVIAPVRERAEKLVNQVSVSPV